MTTQHEMKRRKESMTFSRHYLLIIVSSYLVFCHENSLFNSTPSFLLSSNLTRDSRDPDQEVKERKVRENRRIKCSSRCLSYIHSYFTFSYSFWAFCSCTPCTSSSSSSSRPGHTTIICSFSLPLNRLRVK